MTRQYFLILINPAAGNKKYHYKKEAVIKHLSSKGHTFQEYFTQPQDSSHHLRNYLANQNDITDIVIIGGDGTINLCLNALPHFNYSFSIVNNGTGNDSIKNIYPLKSLEEQVLNITNGKVLNVDIGKCNDQLFLNGVGIGFDGLVVNKMAARKKKKRGLWAYLSIVLLLLPRKFTKEVIITEEDRKEHKSIFSINVTKGSTFGGGFIINPKAHPVDGQLDICVFSKLSLFDKLIILPWVMFGKHGWSRKVSFRKTKKLEIQSDTLLPAHIDGELLESRFYSLMVLPSTLKIKV